MPKQYEEVKRSEKKAGKSDKEAKRIAAKTYIGKGKTKRARSQRAKRLKSDG